MASSVVAGEAVVGGSCHDGSGLHDPTWQRGTWGHSGEKEAEVAPAAWPKPYPDGGLPDPTQQWSPPVLTSTIMSSIWHGSASIRCCRSLGVGV
uniref:Uncharacterized protein n=2 Tax=Oryza TaxID=4527 RepID=A0A0D3EQA0_9ORYZ